MSASTTAQTGARPLTRLSPSAINRYRTCPRQFWFADIERAPRDDRPSAALAQGNAIHHALERFYGLPHEHRTQANLERALRAVWREHRVGAFASAEEERAAGLESIAMLNRFFEGYETAHMPLAREQWVSAKLDSGVEVFGKVDRIDRGPDGGLQLVDYKTVRRELEPDDLSGEPAVQVYTVAAEATYKQPVELVRFIYLPSGNEIRWAPEREDVEAAAERLDRLVDEIQSDESYEAHPGAHCNWCVFALRCPDRGRVELADLRPAEDMPF